MVNAKELMTPKNCNGNHQGYDKAVPLRMFTTVLIIKTKSQKQPDLVRHSGMVYPLQSLDIN